MPMMKQSPIIFLFNSPLGSGCDYVVQTMRIVAKDFSVYGVALGDIISLPRFLLSKDKWIVKKVYGTYVVRPISLIPGIRFRFVRMIAYAATSMLLRIYIDIAYFSLRKFLWFFEPFHIPPLLYLFLGYRTIYDCVDYFPGFHEGAKREHNKIMHRATHVFANSEPLSEKLYVSRPDVITVPLGFAEKLFKSVRFSPGRPKKPPVVGFIGNISSRIDFPLLNTVVRRLPNVQFILVGGFETNVFERKDRTGESLRLLRQRPNVRWISGVSKQLIPRVLSQIDIGIIPYRTNMAFNLFSFPMKVMEYFALGKPVVTTDIVALRPYARK